MDTLIIFWIFIGAVLGGMIGATRQRVGLGIVLGLLLGPIGWLMIFFSSDHHPQCPECFGSIPEGARRCQHCGFVFPKSKLAKPISKSQLFIWCDGEEKGPMSLEEFSNFVLAGNFQNYMRFRFAGETKWRTDDEIESSTGISLPSQ